MHRSPTLQRARKKTGAVQSQRVKGKVVIRAPPPRKVNRVLLRRHLPVHHHLQAHQLQHQPQRLHPPRPLRQALNDHRSEYVASPRAGPKRFGQ